MHHTRFSSSAPNYQEIRAIATHLVGIPVGSFINLLYQTWDEFGIISLSFVMTLIGIKVVVTTALFLEKQISNVKQVSVSNVKQVSNTM